MDFLMSVAPVLKKMGASFGTENMPYLREGDKNSFEIIRAVPRLKSKVEILYPD